MTLVCYFCNVDIPSKEAKRCSRCRIVIYCSKQCQTNSWKASHKYNCIPNETMAALNGAKPEKFSKEWMELEVDKQLSKWIAEWHSCFTKWTMLGLDLANHPADRVMTHCLHLVVEPRHFQDHVYQNYRVVLAEIVPFSKIQETYQALVTHIDPTDFTRLRCVITLQNDDGVVLRVRLLQWNSTSVEQWRNTPKPASKELAADTCNALVYSVEHTPVDEVRRMLKLSK